MRLTRLQRLAVTLSQQYITEIAEMSDAGGDENNWWLDNHLLPRLQANLPHLQEFWILMEYPQYVCWVQGADGTFTRRREFLGRDSPTRTWPLGLH